MNKGWSEKHNVLIRIPNEDEPKFLFYNKIAGFNFNKTLIDTINYHEWKLYSSTVITNLIKLHKSKYSLVIFISQDQEFQGKISKEEFKEIFDIFCNLLFEKGIPIIGLISLKNNNCKKPHTGLWSILTMYYKHYKYPEININECIYIGNEAGRHRTTKTSQYGKMPKDKSYSDRAFAYNIGIKFYDSDHYFKNKKGRKWSFPSAILTIEEKINVLKVYKSLYDPFKNGVMDFLNINFNGFKQFLIMFIAPPTSTKTTMANYIKKDITQKITDEVVILTPKKYGKMRNTGIKKTVKLLHEEIMHGNTVIIDDSNEAIQYRKLYINTVKNYKDVGILLLKLDIPLKIAKHLGQIKIERSKCFDEEPTKTTSYTRYTKNLEEPTVAEFENIDSKRCKLVKLPFIVANIKEWWYLY